MQYQRFDRGGPHYKTDKETQKAARQHIAKRRIRNLLIWLLIIVAAVVFYVSGGKELVVGFAQNQWNKTESTREGGKAAGGLFQRKDLSEAEKAFDEDR